VSRTRDTLSAVTAPSVDRLNLVGATLSSKYRLVRVMGEGGGGIVYEGENLILGERVAIKCIKPGEGQKPEQAAKSHQDFLREAKLLFGLAHPGIVRMYDVGLVEHERGQVPFVVLEYIDGTPLDREIETRKRESRPFTVSEICTLFEGLLTAVAFAHARSVVHRDLKPSNIMLARASVQGELSVKVLDFGTARAGDHVTRLTTLFTPRYAAPEQWDPSRGERGPWTDVFALGLVLYELGTLKQAITGSDIPSILASTLGEARPSFSERKDLAHLEGVLARAVSVAPVARFKHAGEFLAALVSAKNQVRRPVLSPTGTLPLSESASARAMLPSSGTLPLPNGASAREAMLRALKGTLPMNPQGVAAAQDMRQTAASVPDADAPRAPGFSKHLFWIALIVIATIIFLGTCGGLVYTVFVPRKANTPAEIDQAPYSTPLPPERSP
jgi:eukaryotic-like serine/threonine-protein kinase